jgi:protease-4
MRSFFKMTMATFVGLFLFIGFFFILILAVASSGDDEVTLKKDHVLHLKLSGPIYDRTTENPFENFNFMTGETVDGIGLHDLLDQIDKAKRNEYVKGIFLDFAFLQCGYASTKEIRSALEDFKSDGKFIYAYSEGYSQKAYYLMSVADSIFLNPEGIMEFKGLQAQVGFPLDMLAKIGVEPQVIRHGKFKSAVEPFLRNDMSEPNKIQTTAFISSIWNEVVAKVASSRGVSEDDLNKLIDDEALFLANDALTGGLVDKLAYRDEVNALLRKKLGQEESDDLRSLSLSELENVKEKTPVSRDYIAVIYAQGDIISGEGSEYQIGSGRISRAIRKARRDESVKAIVLRVNSPGGDALASDVILREVELAKAEKPVIVSMGDLAASGGYYISCKADRIFAEPNTITGSIGVFGVLMNPEDLLNNKIGIHFDQVMTNTHSDFGDPTRKLNEFEHAKILNFIEKIYADFIGHVAEGRSMEIADVDSIGQGRVWSGSDALEIGLVDEMGGLQDAIAFAAAEAELERLPDAVASQSKKTPFRNL